MRLSMFTATFTTPLFAVALSVTACATVDAPDPAAAAYDATVVDQLARAQEALAAKGVPLTLVGYTPAAAIDDSAALQRVQGAILDDAAIVPQFDGVNAASLTLSSVSRRNQAFLAGEDSQDVVANLRAMALPTLQVGQKALDVTWDNQGHPFTTKLVYDQNGVVYDNLLSNLAFVEPTAVAEASPPTPPAGQPEAGAIKAFANQSWSTRFLDYTITWIWGSTRGKIQLDHYVISCDNWVSFCDDGGASNAWMSLGSAEGRTGRNALRYPRISKLAWGYGWATPTASFSVTWNSGSLTFSASTSGVGSAGHGAGIHTIY
jgi:hypothetical protein